MKSEYDFSNTIKNPYSKRIRKQITININESAITYFKNLSEESGVPYQTLINMYLTDCAENKRRLNMTWT